MSSYVISKKEYVKVAGYIAGIGTCLNSYREPAIYKWNYQEERPFNLDDFYNELTSLYDLNALSVQKQYGDSECEKDYGDYESLFLKYAKVGRTDYLNRHALYADIDLRVAKILKFFNSVKYQIDDEELSDKANSIMNFYLVKLMEIEIDKNYESEEVGSWGEIDL